MARAQLRALQEQSTRQRCDEGLGLRGELALGAVDAQRLRALVRPYGISVEESRSPVPPPGRRWPRR